MGLCIYYSGKIKDAASLPRLIEEVKDIASINKWKYKIFESCFPNNMFDNEEYIESIYGINITPPECETVSITFLSNGIMVCPGRVNFFGNSENEAERNFIYQVAVKTQYAGMITHALIINLFKYLNAKYFKDFKLIDESEYWETGDESLMRANFNKYDALLDNFLLSMQTFPVQKGEDMVAYFERLLGHVNSLKEE